MQGPIFGILHMFLIDHFFRRKCRVCSVLGGCVQKCKR